MLRSCCIIAINTMYKLFLLFSLISIGSAAEQLDSICPKITPFKNFELAKFHRGRWYEVARSRNKIETRGDCVYIDHYVENGQYKVKMNEVLNNKYVTIEGTINLDKNAGKSGVMDYYSRKITDSEAIAFMQLNVMDVDYDNYCILYDCMPSEDGQKIQHEFVWIISRTKNLDEKAKNAIESSLQKFPFIKKDNLVWDHFSGDVCKTGA